MTKGLHKATAFIETYSGVSYVGLNTIDRLTDDQVNELVGGGWFEELKALVPNKDVALGTIGAMAAFVDKAAVLKKLREKFDFDDPQ